MAVHNAQQHTKVPSLLNKAFSSLRLPLCLGLLLALAATGCRKEQISVYRIPKESEAPNMASAQDGPSVPLSYQLPPGWQEQNASGMSLKLFSIASDKAEMSIMNFPGEGASQLNLVNIVRDSAGLPPLSDDGLAKLIQPVTVGSETGSLIDLTAATTSSPNAAPTNSIMVAVIPHGGVTWFFKLFGAPDVVSAQKPALISFLKSFSFPSGAANVLPPGHGQTGFTSANTGREPAAPAPAFAPPSGDKPLWSPPADWREVSPGQMLLAKFSIAGTDGEANVNISSLAGEGGGLLMNINRWRKQLGLSEVKPEDVDKAYTSLDVLGGKAMLVDMSGTENGKPTRLLGVIFPRSGQTWFYKMMGDAAVATREKDAFVKFVQSVQYPNG